jgi:hypothetical protein
MAVSKLSASDKKTAGIHAQLHQDIPVRCTFKILGKWQLLQAFHGAAA